MSSLRLFTGLFRRFRSRVLNSPVQRVGQCRLCGRCCRDILLKYEGKWLRRDKDYRAMLEALPAYARFEHTGYDDQGFMTFTCKSLGRDNLCAAYGKRPSLCRSYPSDSLYYQGGSLRADCGYSFRAETFRDAITRRLARKNDFPQVLNKELHKVDTKSETKEDTKK